ncbi:MAG: type II secretion system F family protein [Candidatus Bathyarchaeota archaeon]|nr:MAG: type II secretion system F family protein [Candidatus Bathyarchaeota archaeon]
MASSLNPLRLLNSLLSLLSGKQKATEVDKELPFTVMLFTLMAASGVAVYDAWKKMCRISLLPKTQNEAKEVVRQVEVLGRDPLTVMRKKAEDATSKNYRDFLGGYVSSVKSGINVVSFLRTKLRSVLETQSAAALRSIERLGTLVEAYAVMLIVTLCVYILYVVIGTTSTFEYMSVGLSTSASEPLMYALMFLATPFITFVFMAIANLARQSNLLSVKEAYRIALLSAGASLGFLGAVMFLPQLGVVIEILTLPGLVAFSLLTASLAPAFVYWKIARTNLAAEEAMPSFLRDVTESRKIGLSPIKSIIHATKRTGYGSFSEILKLIRSQIEWGVPLRRIFSNVRRRIRSWPVLVYFLILIETIEFGGGDANALEILSEYSEKNRDIEANKRSTLKPYVLLAFVWSVLIALTTSIVAITIFVLTQITAPGASPAMFAAMEQQIMMFSIGIIFQCWMSGFFIGKISEGTFAAGFKYSGMLAVTGYISLFFSQNYLLGMVGAAPI